MAAPKKFDVIFRQYDLRGTENEGLDGAFARRLGWAYAEFLKNQKIKEKLKVSVGLDARLSSPSLAKSLIKGLTENNVEVFELGVCPTPLLYFSLFTLPVDGGIMITGSHNPPEYNGFKLCIGRETISGKEIQKLKEFFYQTNPKESLKVSPLAKARKIDIVRPYLSHMENEFAYLKDLPELKIAVDCGNGTAGLVAPEILRKVGCEVIELFTKPNGSFPNHHPDPTVIENLKDLQEAVIKEKCEFGIAFDGDADRLGVVNESGDVVFGDKLLAIFAGSILKEKPQAKVISEVKCSQLVYQEIERLGGKPIMWKTGHSLIKKKMKEEKALLAGEMSGHFFFADRYFGYDDAIYAALRLVEILKERKSHQSRVKLSHLYAHFPLTFSTPEIRLECQEDEKKRLVENIKKKLLDHQQAKLQPLIRDLNFIDGIRITFEYGWGLIRASNTQAALVMRVEAKSEAILKEYQSFIEKNLKECKKI